MSTGKEKHVLVGHTGDITSIVLSLDSENLISTGIDDTTRLWDISVGNFRRVLSCQAFRRQVSTSPAAMLLASKHESKIHVQDITSGKVRHVLSGSTDNQSKKYEINPNVLG